jgi:L-lactate dehydrogenase complex protein LldE
MPEQHVTQGDRNEPALTDPFVPTMAFRPRVALFVTCLVDLMRPQVGMAALKLLREAGCDVVIPRTQTCCGQPAFNSGDRRGASALARQVITAFESYAYVVVPSGSCAGMIHAHYPEVLAGDPVWLPRAQALAAKTHELMSFLADVVDWRPVGERLAQSATYHHSCSGLREMGVSRQPLALLSQIDGLALKPLVGAETCCGFGGTFCVKYPDISNAIAGDKAAAVTATGADLLLAGDLGCLMLMAGTLNRRGSTVRAFHAAEILAGMASGPAIGEEL